MPIFNPLDDPSSLQTVRVLGSLLLVGFGGIVVAERGRLTRIPHSVLFQRWRTWMVIAPIFALAVLAGPATTAALVAVVAVVGLLEYAAVAKVTGWPRQAMFASGAVVLGVALAAPEHLLSVLVLSLLALAVASFAKGDGDEFRAMALAFLGVAYIPLLLAHAVLLTSRVEGGGGLLLTLGLAVAMSDVAAFACGKLFGRRRLAPRLSPNKTWAGACGNVIGAYAAFAIRRFALPDMAVWALLLLPALVALADIAGDLFESRIKRSFGVKDAAGWLPGFGGLLDRIDSLLFVLPVAYYFMLVAR